MKIFLIGMPGSGKSTVMQCYKEKYGKKVYDTDAIVESRHGKISELFAKFGEEYFRGLETETIKEVCGIGEDAFISTGGGAVLREENVRLFKSAGKIVYLRASIQTLLIRLEGDTSRPLLQGNKKERLTELFSRRRALYESVADIIIDTDGLTPDGVLEQIFVLSEETL